jgi:hypothetical protein
MNRRTHLEHPYGTIESFDAFEERIGFQFALDYLDSIRATPDPKLAMKLAEDAAHWAGETPSARAREVVEACFRAAVAKSREVDVPPPQGKDD